MDKPLLVSVMEDFGKFRDQTGRFPPIGTLVVDSFRQTAAFNEVGDNEAPLAIPPYVMHGNDARVPKLGDLTSFSEKLVCLIGRGKAIRSWHFDRDRPLQFGIKALPHLSEATSPHQFIEPVSPKAPGKGCPSTVPRVHLAIRRIALRKPVH